MAMVAQAGIELMTAGRCALNKRLATIVAMTKLRDSTSTGCLLVTHLPVKAERLRRPELAGLPLIVTTGNHGRQTVPGCIGQGGGSPGKDRRLRKLCPYAPTPLPCRPIPSICPRSTTVCWQPCAEWSLTLSPAGLGAFYLDLTGMAGMYGGIDGLADAILSVCDGRLSPRLGIGAGKFLAYCAAARADAGGWLRVPDDAAAWLAPLPVSWLPLERDDTARAGRLRHRHPGRRGGAAPYIPCGVSWAARTPRLEPRQRDRPGAGYSNYPPGKTVGASRVSLPGGHRRRREGWTAGLVRTSLALPRVARSPGRARDFGGQPAGRRRVAV